MSAYPTARDALARHLYVHVPDGPDVALTVTEQRAGAQEWDTGQAKPDDVADCYRRADRILADMKAAR